MSSKRMCIIGGAGIMCVCIFLVCLQYSQSSRGRTIEFENMVYDDGVKTQPDELSVRHEFRFRNASNASVRIMDIKTDCGCTIANKSAIRKYLPGEEGVIEAQLQLGAVGRKISHLMIYTDAEKKPMILTIGASYWPESYATAVPGKINMGNVWSNDNTEEMFVELLSNTEDVVKTICTVKKGNVSAEVIGKSQKKDKTLLGYYSTTFKLRLKVNKTISGDFEDEVNISFNPKICDDVIIPVKGKVVTEWLCVPDILVITIEPKSESLDKEGRIVNIKNRKGVNIRLKSIRNPLKKYVKVLTIKSEGQEIRIQVKGTSIPEKTTSGTLSLILLDEEGRKSIVDIPTIVKGV